MPKTKPGIATALDASTNPPAHSPQRQTEFPTDGCVRAVIDAVLPAVDGGRFPIKRIAGASIRITAHCFTDGHDALRVVLKWRALSGAAATTQPHEVPMKALGNDVWEAEFTPPVPGRYGYTVAAWVDPFDSWRHELIRRVDADDIRIAAQVGAVEIAAAASRAQGTDRKTLAAWAASLKKSAVAKVKEAKDTRSKAAKVPEAAAASPETDAAIVASSATLKALALDEEMAALIARYPDRRFEARYAIELPLTVERARAGFSTWYELFPALHRASRACMAPSRTSRRDSRPSRRWVSTCCISRPSTRSGASTARGATTHWSRSPATSAARGRSVPKKAAIKPYWPSWGRPKTFVIW